MTQIVGGLRARLIRENLYEQLNAALDDLNWFDPTNPNLPITFISKQKEADEEIELNTAILTDDQEISVGFELGSNFTEFTWDFFVDFYAESDALGLHFIRDVRDLLSDRFSGVTFSSFPVLDLRQPTPPLLFNCHIPLESVDTDRAYGFRELWRQHWYSCSFQVLDYYTDQDSS